MRLPIVDADGHVVEPFELWREQMPERFRDRVWRREVDADGRERLFHDGVELDVEWTTGTLSTPGGVRDTGSLDIDFDTEVDPAVNDPTRRLELMDTQGIAVSVLFPSMMLGISDVRDPEMQTAYAVVYNEWIADFCATDPARLKWGALVPTASVEDCVAVAERALEKGAAAVMVPPIFDHDQTPLSSERLAPLHGLVEESRVPLVSHAINPANGGLNISRHLTGRVQWQMGYSIQSQLATLHVLDSDLLDRYPNLRIGFFEGDLGWVEHWFERLDETFRKMALVARPRDKSVVEDFRRQCAMSADMNDPLLAEAVAYLGAEHVLFASDWPHHDGSFPDPIAAVRDHPRLTDAQKREILVHAPARFFDIDIDGVVAGLGEGWSLDAPLASIPGLLPEDATMRSPN